MPYLTNTGILDGVSSLQKAYELMPFLFESHLRAGADLDRKTTIRWRITLSLLWSRHFSDYFTLHRGDSAT